MYNLHKKTLRWRPTCYSDVTAALMWIDSATSVQACQYLTSPMKLPDFPTTSSETYLLWLLPQLNPECCVPDVNGDLSLVASPPSCRPECAARPEHRGLGRENESFDTGGGMRAGKEKYVYAAFHIRLLLNNNISLAELFFFSSQKLVTSSAGTRQSKMVYLHIYFTLCRQCLLEPAQSLKIKRPHAAGRAADPVAVSPLSRHFWWEMTGTGRGGVSNTHSP